MVYGYCLCPHRSGARIQSPESTYTEHAGCATLPLSRLFRWDRLSKPRQSSCYSNSLLSHNTHQCWSYECVFVDARNLNSGHHSCALHTFLQSAAVISIRTVTQTFPCSCFWSGMFLTWPCLVFDAKLLCFMIWLYFSSYLVNDAEHLMQRKA
jgi:hypothetical protein